MIPMHWNYQGQIDSYWPKSTAVLFFPALTSLLFILFRLIPIFDPKRNNYVLFKKEWEGIQIVIIGFMVFLHLLTFYLSFNPEVSIVPGIFYGMGILFILIGRYLPKIKQNYFVGIKLPWTLSSTDNWNKTHKFGGWCFIISGVIIFLEAFLLWNQVIVILSSIFFSVLAPMAYSFILYKKSK